MGTRRQKQQKKTTLLLSPFLDWKHTLLNKRLLSRTLDPLHNPPDVFIVWESDCVEYIQLLMFYKLKFTILVCFVGFIWRSEVSFTPESLNHDSIELHVIVILYMFDLVSFGFTLQSCELTKIFYMTYFSWQWVCVWCWLVVNFVGSLLLNSGRKICEQINFVDTVIMASYVWKAPKWQKLVTKDIIVSLQGAKCRLSEVMAQKAKSSKYFYTIPQPSKWIHKKSLHSLIAVVTKYQFWRNGSLIFIFQNFTDIHWTQKWQRAVKYNVMWYL